MAFSAEPGEQHYNPIGVVHGGLAATLLDSAMGASYTARFRSAPAIRPSRPSSTWCARSRPRAGPIVAEGRVLHRGSRVATAEGRLVREADGKLLAHGSSTCLVLSG